MKIHNTSLFSIIILLNIHFNAHDSPHEPTNFGLTLDGFQYLPVGSDLNNFVISGGDITVIPLEQMMDRSGNLNLGMLSVPHELGHQFGLKHPVSTEQGNLMNDTLNTGNTSLSRIHRNYIRNRKSSPGIKP